MAIDCNSARARAVFSAFNARISVSRSSQRRSPVLISAMRHFPLSSFTRRKAVSTWAVTTAELPAVEISFTRTASEGSWIPAMRAINFRASLGVRSPAARVRLTTKKEPAATNATREIISMLRLVMIDNSLGSPEMFTTRIRAQINFGCMLCPPAFAAWFATGSW